MSRVEDLNVVIKCLIELGEKEHFDIEGDIDASIKAITPRIKPILFEKGLRFSKKSLGHLLFNGYLELACSAAEMSRRMKERLDKERSAPRQREVEWVEKEERISKGFVRWFLTTHQLTLDDKGLLIGCKEATAEFKKLMGQAGLTSPAEDWELSDFFGDAIIEMDIPSAPERETAHCK